MFKAIVAVFRPRHNVAFRRPMDRGSQRGFLSFFSGAVGALRGGAVAAASVPAPLAQPARPMVINTRSYAPPVLDSLEAMRRSSAMPGVEALTHLLNQHPKARAAFKQLAIVEQTMKLAKIDPLSSVPTTILVHAARQLEGLAAPFSSDDLKAIHEQMTKRAGLTTSLVGVERPPWALDPMPVGEVVEPSRPFPLVDMFEDVKIENNGFAETRPMEDRPRLRP